MPRPPLPVHPAPPKTPTVTASRPLSPLAHGLLLTGGTAWLYALFVAISAATGYRFEIAGEGADLGIPLPATWFHAALFGTIGGAFWLVGRRWDAPRFADLRARQPWLVPAIAAFFTFPAGVALIFVLVR